MLVYFILEKLSAVNTLMETFGNRRTEQKQIQKYFIKPIKDTFEFIISYNDYNNQNT